MCLLNLNNPSSYCKHSECRIQNPNIQHGDAYIIPNDKKRGPIQSISEMLAESLLKKLKEDSNRCIRQPVQEAGLE